MKMSQRFRDKYVEDSRFSFYFSCLHSTFFFPRTKAALNLSPPMRQNNVTMKSRKQRASLWIKWNGSFSSALLCRSISGSSCCAFKYTLRSRRFHAIMLICGAFLAPFHYQFLIVFLSFPISVRPLQAFLLLGSGGAARPAAAGRWPILRPQVRRAVAIQKSVFVLSSVLTCEDVYRAKASCCVCKIMDSHLMAWIRSRESVFFFPF